MKKNTEIKIVQKEKDRNIKREREYIKPWIGWKKAEPSVRGGKEKGGGYEVLPPPIPQG